MNGGEGNCCPSDNLKVTLTARPVGSIKTPSTLNKLKLSGLASMSKGKGYDKAHRLSSKVEYFCRHHPEQTEKKIKQELKKLK